MLNMMRTAIGYFAITAIPNVTYLRTTEDFCNFWYKKKVLTKKIFTNIHLMCFDKGPNIKALVLS